MANKSLDLKLLEKTHILFSAEHLQIPCKGKNVVGQWETVVLW